MEHFETIVSRHGEHGAQAILENWERFAGVRPAFTKTLEERWADFLRATDTFANAAAA